MDWYNFWQNYRLIEIKTNEDLLYQAGKTVNKKPISKDQFNLIIKGIKNVLSLDTSDILLDLCCGNGIITYELSKSVKKVIGIDFSKPFIQNAIKYKSNQNIKYIIYDINLIDELQHTLKKNHITKVLMYGGLGYFTPNEIDNVLKELLHLNSNEIKIMFGGILNKERKLKFYNTLPRKMDYLINVKLLQSEVGLGRWWTKEEIQHIAKRNNITCNILPQNPTLNTAHYRMDVLLEKNRSNSK